MDALQFAYWLQGFAELNSQPPSPEQWKSIREHLATVFTKVTPPVQTNPDLFKEYPPKFHTPGPTPLKYPEIICGVGNR